MQAAPNEEEALVRAAQAGDREAFAQLYEANVDRVHRYVMARLANFPDAEDITAEVFIRAMKALPAYQPRGVPFIAWLTRIAHNESVNALKKRTRRGEMPLTDTFTAADNPEQSALQLPQASV